MLTELLITMQRKQPLIKHLKALFTPCGAPNVQYFQPPIETWYTFSHFPRSEFAADWISLVYLFSFLIGDVIARHQFSSSTQFRGNSAFRGVETKRAHSRFRPELLGCRSRSGIMLNTLPLISRPRHLHLSPRSLSDKKRQPTSFVLRIIHIHAQKQSISLSLRRTTFNVIFPGLKQNSTSSRLK
jgi:hypothetical protein